MALRVTCGTCETRLQVKDELAGRRVKCPKCSSAIDVPNVSAMPAKQTAKIARPATKESPVREQATCPSCGTALPPKSVLCVTCGYHLLQKKHLSTQVTPQQDDISDEEALRLVKAATCPQCGGLLVQPEGFCPECTGETSTARGERQLAKLRAKREAKKQETISVPEGTYEQRLAEQQEASHPYDDYRQAAISRLTGMWSDVDALAENDHAAWRKAVEHWPVELRQCEPPKELFDLPRLHPENRRTFELLTQGIQRLAEITAADLALKVDKNHQSEFRQRAHSRISMLCRLAKRLGKHHRGQNAVLVDLDVSGIDSYAFQAGSEILHEELGKALSKRHLQVGGLAASAESWLGSQRLMTLQILEWEEGPDGSLNSTTRIHYVDEDAGPIDEKEFEKTTPFQCRSLRFVGRAGTLAREVKKDWVEHVLGEIPASILQAGEPAWAGINIVCPCCGHPDILTERAIPSFQRCLSCDQDSMTGQPQAELAKASQADEKTTVAVAALISSALPIIGFWIFAVMTGRMPLSALAVTHLLAIVAMIFSVKAFLRSRAEQCQVRAKQATFVAKFKCPEAIAKNQQTIKVIGTQTS